MRRAFTLIEVLVVIAIIAIVCAIVFPVFRSAKASAKKIACINNLSQVGKSVLLYMGDYDDKFPYGLDAVDRYRPEIWSEWPAWQARIPYMEMLHEVLQPYLKNHDIFHCPSDRGTEVVENQFPMTLLSAPSAFETFGTSYNYRTELAFRGMCQSDMEWPATTNVLFDAAGHWHGSERAVRPSDPYQTAYQLMRGYRYNVLYCDMHVKSIQYQALQKAWSYPP